MILSYTAKGQFNLLNISFDSIFGRIKLFLVISVWMFIQSGIFNHYNIMLCMDLFLYVCCFCFWILWCFG